MVKVLISIPPDIARVAARADQALTGALPVGRFDRPHLRGFPLLCPMCGGQMRLIAFITEGAQIRKILDHIGVDSEPPRIAPARGPPIVGGL
jgi:hypothetical protein